MQDAACKDLSFQDVVAGPLAKTEGIQFDSCQGHIETETPLGNGGAYLLKNISIKTDLTTETAENTEKRFNRR